MITLKMKPDQVKTCLQYLLNFNCFQDQVQKQSIPLPENSTHSSSLSSTLLQIPSLYVFMSHNFCSLPPAFFFFNLSLTPSDMSFSIKFSPKSFLTNLSCTLWKLNWMLFLWNTQHPLAFTQICTLHFVFFCILVCFPYQTANFWRTGPEDYASLYYCAPKISTSIL